MLRLGLALPLAFGLIVDMERLLQLEDAELDHKHGDGHGPCVTPREVRQCLADHKEDKEQLIRCLDWPLNECAPAQYPPPPRELCPMPKDVMHCIHSHKKDIDGMNTCVEDLKKACKDTPHVPPHSLTEGDEDNEENESCAKAIIQCGTEHKDDAKEMMKCFEEAAVKPCVAEICPNPNEMVNCVTDHKDDVKAMVKCSDDLMKACVCPKPKAMMDCVKENKKDLKAMEKCVEDELRKCKRDPCLDSLWCLKDCNDPDAETGCDDCIQTISDSCGLPEEVTACMEAAETMKEECKWKSTEGTLGADWGTCMKSVKDMLTTCYKLAPYALE